MNDAIFATSHNSCPLAVVPSGRSRPPVVGGHLAVPAAPAALPGVEPSRRTPTSPPAGPRPPDRTDGAGSASARNAPTRPATRVSRGRHPRRRPPRARRGRRPATIAIRRANGVPRRSRHRRPGSIRSRRHAGTRGRPADERASSDSRYPASPGRRSRGGVSCRYQGGAMARIGHSDSDDPVPGAEPPRAHADARRPHEPAARRTRRQRRRPSSAMSER